MRYLPSILLIICIIALVLMYVHKQPGYKQEMDRLEAENKKIKNRLDSAYQVIYQSGQREIALKARYMALQTRTAQEVERADNYLKLYQNERKRNNRAFSDRQIDSLLNTVRP